MRIEADHVARIGHEVRERVHIVEIRLAIPIVDQEFDPADIQTRPPRDPLRRRDDLARRVGTLHPHPGLGRIERTRRSRQRPPVRRLAHVGRTQVEHRIGRRKDVDAVEEVSPKQLDPSDVPRTHRRHLLDQRDAIDAEIERPPLARRRQRRRILESLDPSTAAADVRLDQNRKPQAGARRHDRLRAVAEPGPGVRDAQLLEQIQLERLRRVHLVCRRAVHHGDADPVQVPEPLQRVESRLSMPAQIGGRTRAVEHQRIRHAALGRIVGVRRRIEADVRDPPAIQFGKQGTEPVRMLVENGDRLHRNSRMKEAAEYACVGVRKDSNGHRSPCSPQSLVPSP